jgi:hypothetical protein
VYDIIFLCSDTETSRNSFSKLQERFPLVKRVVITDTVRTAFDQAIKKAFTKMCWIVWNDIEVLDTFNFDYKVPEWDQKFIHVFRNGSYYDGICLVPKAHKLTNREITNRFFINKKEVDVVASTPHLYDIVFISFHEEFADSNFEKLKSRSPHRNIHRIDGVVGIHNAHIAAAKLSTTTMFWVVDADAEIVNDFKFDYQVPYYDQTMVHVWRSRNPINKLEYGYGGVKLFPKQLTIDMNTNTMDMTMNISNKFKVVEKVSNITAFNTSPFNAWRSAFRECCKLVVINNDESLHRLYRWCELNEQVQYGGHAYMGAIQGKQYGEKNASNPEALSKINDFKWLQDQWSLEKSQLLPEHKQ